ncbi:MAG: SDR family NAD(P)-dependent oxidoreductase [Dehalococcoidia bacterium]
MSAPLIPGQVVALIGAGTDRDRSLIVPLVADGVRVALATMDRSQAQEFAMNSIANELWALGAEQFVRLMDAGDPSAVVAFADEVFDQYGRCDLALIAHSQPSDVEIDELSFDEWEPLLRANLSGAFLALQAFGRLMERAHGGRIVLVESEGVSAANLAANQGLRGLAEAAERAWPDRGVSVEVTSAAAGVG